MFEVSTPTERSIVMRRWFDAPRPLVFETWTKPEHVSQWWDPSGNPLEVCEIDLRPNGAFRWVNRAPAGGEGHSFSGIYREIAPPGKLVFTVQMFAAGPEAVATLVFAEEGAQTGLTMTIECATEWERDALLRMRVETGTAKTLGNLAGYLERLTPPRLAPAKSSGS